MSDNQDKYGGFDKDVLLGIYSALNAVQLDYNERKWETVRSASLLTLGMLAAVGGLVSRSDISHSRFALGVMGLSLMVFGTAIFRWTRRNIYRESALQYHVEFPMYQIEKLLGVHQEIPESLRWLPDSKYIFGEKHLNYEFRAAIDMQNPKEVKEQKESPVNAWVTRRLKYHEFRQTVGIFTLILLSICFFVGAVLLAVAIRGPKP
jgi:hypothetical protein